MSDLGIGGLRGSGHRARPRRARGCVPLLLTFALLVVGGGFAYVKGVDFIRDRLSGPSPQDYEGNGHKPAVVIEVKPGDSGTDIARKLHDAGVIASVGAFTRAAAEDSRSSSIQVGRYRLLSEMSAEKVLDVLVDPDSQIQKPTVTIPEGLRATEILASIAEQTDFSVKELRAAYDDTAALGLPAYAGGEAEGYLFPSTYELEPKDTAADLLAAMVERFKSRATELDLQGRAAELGYRPHDVVTVASLVQAEAGTADMDKVASVVYNRLAEPMPLQFDSTLHYALKLRGNVTTSDEQRSIDSPYNTYTQPGLPPTPIDSPGAEALEAALQPADTNFLYFVTVNLATGKTKFASSLDEHNRNVARYREYCLTSDEC